MKFPKLFRRNQPEQIKASSVGSAIVMTPGQPVWSGRDYASFADEAYGRNVVAYQAINRIADAVASVKWMAKRGDEEIPNHPLLQLLRRPNPGQSGPQYIRAKVGYLMISGNGYEERVTVGGEVRELYQLRPDRVKVVPASNGFPAGYIYTANSKAIRFPVDENGNSDLRHLKMFNPLNDWYGMSPVEAGAYAIDQSNESMKWVQSLLQNSARPSGALTTKDGAELSDDNFNRLKAQIEDQYSGAMNAGRPMLLEGGLSWQQMGLSPADMSLLETKFSAARDICLSFGVPPQLLGIPGDNTYSNYVEARLSFWEDTVIPLLDLIAADWSSWLGAPYGIELVPDLDDIPAIVDKRQSLWDMADKSLDLTINERRALKGYGPVYGGDVLYVTVGQIPITDLSAPIDTPEDASKMAYGK